MKSTINTDIKATKTGKLHCVQKSHEISMGESVEKIKNRIFLKKQISKKKFKHVFVGIKFISAY